MNPIKFKDFKTDFFDRKIVSIGTNDDNPEFPNELELFHIWWDGSLKFFFIRLTDTLLNMLELDPDSNKFLSLDDAKKQAQDIFEQVINRINETQEQEDETETNEE